MEPAVLQTAAGALWMTDPTCKSALYLQNQLKNEPITVTPILYLSNGRRYVLPDVTLEPSGIAIIDLNKGLAQNGIAPYANLFGHAEIQYKWAWAAVSAYVRNLDGAHSIVFPFGLRTPPQPTTQPANGEPQLLEGMWWKEEPDVTAFVALANITASPIAATVQATDAHDNVLGSHQIVVSPHGTKMVSLTELHATTDQGGGVSVVHAGPKDGIVVNAALEDEAVGYSANLPIGPPPSTKVESTTTTFAEIGLMAGEADPMMSFPAGTAFRPYSVVRNISDQPTTVKPTLWWMAANEPHSASLPAFSVPLHQTHVLDLTSALAAAGLKNYNGSLNLILDVQGPAQGLAMASGSIDEKNTYVFEVVPRAVLESVSKSLGHWSINNGDDTMITLWNPADEEQDFTFTVFFSGGQYKWPVHLGPRVTQTFNISDIIHNQIPDVDGNTIPAGVHEGSAEIAGTRGENEHILVVMDAGTYNIQKATCVCEWLTCNGITGVALVANPWAVGTGKTNQLNFTETYNTGSKYNVNGQSKWSSSKTTVATVTTGLVKGVGGGSANVTVQDQYYEPAYVQNLCGQPPLPSCPVSTFEPNQTAPGNVTPSVSFSSISNVAVGKTGTLIATVTPSSNTVPISLSITPSATIVSPTGTFTNNTTVTVLAASIGTATITATVSNPDGGSSIPVGSTSFPVVTAAQVPS